MSGDCEYFFGAKTIRLNKSSKKIAAVIHDINKNGFSSKNDFHIGSAGKSVLRFAKENGIGMGDGNIYFSRAYYTHAVREIKKDKRLSDRELIAFPSIKKRLTVYWDGEAFIYTDNRIKYIVRPNQKIKLPGGKTKVVALITAGKTGSKTDFNGSRYIKI